MSPDVRHNFLSMIQQFRPRATFPFQQSTHALSRKSPRSFSASTVVHSYPQSLAARTTRTFSRKMATFNPDYEHFFRYTSGRWLWDEEQQLRDRYKAFNVAELQIVAAQAIGSGNCVSMIKLAEGGYNKVFRLLMGDGKQVLARIPNPNAGPPFYTTASEVATMQFARDILQIPIPQVLAWSATSHNSVGSEYIIMEEATGTQLAIVWDSLGPDVKLSVMREVVSIETKMMSLSFSHYGSIYFASDAVEGAVPANIISETSAELKEKVSKAYTIGPTVDRGFWNKERSTMDISRGPWSNPKDYAECVGRREIKWIKNYAVPRPPSEARLISKAQNCPQAHIQLLEKFLQIAPCLMDVDPEITLSTLWHTDLHSSNIFVANGHITAVIDWQSSWAGPLFLQAQPPPLVDYQGGVLLKRPDNFDSLDPEQQTEIKRKIFKSTLFQLYLVETEKRNPMLTKAFHVDHGKTRRLPIELAGNTWDDDIVSFREALINIEKYWKELGIQGECPYHFSRDELAGHALDAEGWNEVQDFFDSIEDLVKRDGWTHLETFDVALRLFSDLRKGGLEHLKGEDRENFEKETRWANSRH